MPEPRSRRDVLTKGALGAAAAGVVWSAPRIEGLSLRPDYAAAQTMSGASFDLTVPYPSSSLVSPSPTPGLSGALVATLLDAHGVGSLVGSAAAVNCAITGFDVLYGDSPGTFTVNSIITNPGVSSLQFGVAASGLPSNLTMHVTCT